MKFFKYEDNNSEPELVVLPFWEDLQQANSVASHLSQYKKQIHSPTLKKDFLGKEGELIFLYPSEKPYRLALLGLGKKEKLNVEKLRRIYSQLTRACHQKKLQDIALLLPEALLSEEELMVGISEGLLLANYSFNKLKRVSRSDHSLLKTVGLIGVTKKGLTIAKRSLIIAEGVYMARDLVNDNADQITAQYLSHFAQELARQLPHSKATILKKRELEKEKMGLLLAVNRGSTSDPALIILSYRGNPKSKDHTILIGKGITYDTGGLNLKPVASMDTMKADMAGGATVLGTIYSIAKLGLKVNVTAMIPASENSISAESFKPGDVYRSYAGHMIEITNPDAEGRLVLADAISYAKRRLQPTRIIDIATLTGAIDIALGSEACGLFSNDDALANALHQSAERTFERVWRLPLFEEYRDSLKSEIGDLKNSAGRSASSSLAAIFLQEFVEETPWAHLDIASVGYLNEKKRYHPKFGTGFGVRLLVDLLSHTQRRMTEDK